MSKSDTPLEYIDTTRARNQQKTPSFAGDTPINGLDTETANGDIFSIGMYLGERDEFIEKTRERALTEAEVLEVLTYRPLKNSLNFWYNLNFDANVVLKFLPKAKLQELKLQNRVEYDPDNLNYSLTITYIPKKVLKIQDSNRNTYNHYDISQFTYSGPLEQAVSDWLPGNQTKADENLDVRKFGLLTGPARDSERYETHTRPVNQYVASRIDEISHYLKEDCRLTCEIAKEVIDTAENQIEPPIPMGKPYSTGYIAADYVRNRNKYSNKFEPKYIQSPFWQAYAGGRFEVIKRGAIGDVAGPDINSAYPAIYADLPNPATLHWTGYFDRGPGKPTEQLTVDKLKQADYGAVKVTVSTDRSRPVQPFAVKNNTTQNRVEYPALDGVTLWCLKETFLFALKHNFLTDWSLENAVLGDEIDGTEYPYKWAPEVYDKRKTLGASGDKRKATLLKIILNSLYGKTCQTQLKVKPLSEAETLPGVPDDIDVTDINITPNNSDLPDDLTPVIDPKQNEMYVEYQESGAMFNPFIATYITGLTRLKLLKGVVENNLEENIVMLATDCLMFEREAFEGTELERQAENDPDNYADALGGWDYDYVGDGFVVGSGVYQVDRYDKDETKHGLRGFASFGSDNNDYNTLREGFKAEPDGIDVTSTRPQTYGDVLHLNKSLQTIGQFQDTERTLNPDFDGKRVWPSEVDGTDLLNNTQTSRPKLYDGDVWHTE